MRKFGISVKVSTLSSKMMTEKKSTNMQIVVPGPCDSSDQAKIYMYDLGRSLLTFKEFENLCSTLLFKQTLFENVSKPGIIEIDLSEYFRLVSR